MFNPHLIQIVLPLGLILFLPGAGPCQEPPSTEHRKFLLDHVPPNDRATSRFAAQAGYIPTNTLAFREYALDLLLKYVNDLNQKWELGLPRHVTSDAVTGFDAFPQVTGVKGNLTISNRFGLSVLHGKLIGFCDRLHWSSGWANDPLPALPLPGATNADIRTPLTIDEAYKRAFEGHGARNQPYHQKMLQLANMTNSLTKADALRIAQEGFLKLGFTEKELKLKAPEVNQFMYSPEGQNTVFPLPLYHIAWEAQNDPGFKPVRMEVSGITRRIVDYFNVTPQIIVPLPTNYFQMLGVPPEPHLWGKQYGYDPINTPAFQDYAIRFIAQKANWLNRAWTLGLTTPVTTNQLSRISAIPFTNAFLVSAEVTNRFHLQIGEGMVQIFKDYEQVSDAFVRSKERMAWALKQNNLLTRSSALTLAREKLAQIGIDEKKLRLPKPLVRQVREPFPDEEQLHDLPFFFIEWKWSDSEEEHAVMAMELSGITKQVTFFANSCTNTPRFSLPPHYDQILGLR